MRRLLARWSDLDVRDYAGLLELAEGWSVAELRVREDLWVAGRTLGRLDLRAEGLAVLGVHRPDGTYLGVPDAGTLVGTGDRLLLYGRGERIAELGLRRAGPEGDAAHGAAVARQRAVAAEQVVADVRSGGATAPAAGG